MRNRIPSFALAAMLAVVPSIVGVVSASSATAVTPPDPACSGTVTTPCLFHGFEIDGDTSVDGGGIDWKSPTVTGSGDLNNFTDATGSGDNIFGNGSKESDQSTWSCTTNKAPMKNDLASGQLWFQTVDGTQYIYGDFTRVGVNGSAHIDYEFNKASASLSGSCAGLPVRANGDVLIAFDTNNGGATITVTAYKYSNGAWTNIATSTNQFAGLANISPARSDAGLSPGAFGEAGLDLTHTVGTFACGEFGAAWMKTRAAVGGGTGLVTDGQAELKDYTTPQKINTGNCPTSNLAKTVHDDTTDPAGHTQPSAGPISANPGDQLTYTLSYTNTGAAPATNVVVSDPIPANSTYVSGSCVPATCTVSGGTISWPAVPSVDPNSTPLTYSFSVKLASTFPAGNTPVTNTGHVTTHEEGNTDSNTVTVNVGAAPYLNLTKIADHGVVNGGDPIGYTITLRNTGDADATNVKISDTLPSNGGVAWTVDAPQTATCPITSGVMVCNVGTLAAGSAFTVHISSTASLADCGSQVSNFATATATGGLTANSEDNNYGNPTTIKVNCASLTVTKTADNGTVAGGQQVGYTIKVTNSGSGDANNVTISDTLPNNISGLNWGLKTAVSGCSVSPVSTATPPAPQVLSCTFAKVAANTTITIDVVSATPATACGTLSNAATWSSNNAGSGTTSPPAVITVTCPALTLVKTADNSGAISAGDAIGYTLTLTNNGNGAATNVVVTDNLQPGPSSAPFTWTTSSPGCSISGLKLTCSYASVAGNGTQVTIHVSSPTVAADCGTYTNSASVSADNSLTVNSNTASETVNCPNISLTKTSDSGSVTVGSQIGYKITVSNLGSGNAYNVKVTDTLPNNPGLTWSLETAVSGCSISPTTSQTDPNHQVLTCTFATLAPNASKVMHVISQTSGSTCGTVSNSASVTLDNGTGMQTATVNIGVGCAVLHVTKTACPQSTVVPGGLLTYTIAFSNSGTAAANPASLVDTLPSGVTVANSGGGQVSPDGSTVTWAVGPLAAGGSGTETLVVQVNAGTTGTITNNVSLSSPQAQATATSSASVTVSNAGAVTHGSSYGIDVNALGGEVINHLGSASTSAPPNGQPVDKNVITVPSILGVLSADVVNTTSTSTVTDESDSTATAETAHINLLGGAITADAIEGVSQSTASSTTASYDSSGSTFANLVINGKSVTNVSPNTSITVYLPGTKIVLARGVLYEESGTSGLNNGVWSATHSVTMIDITLVQGLGTLPAGAHITVSHAQSDASYPSGLACGTNPNLVSGNAYTAYANGTFLGSPLVTGQVGDAELPITGGSNSDNVALVSLSPLATAGAGVNYTNGQTTSNPVTATSGSNVANVSLLGGLVTANAIDVKSSSTASANNASTSFGATCANGSCPSGCVTSSPCFVNLAVNGHSIVGINGGTVPPNKVIAIPQPDGGLVEVILNEQTTSSTGGNTEGDINAIHVYVLKSTGALNAEVIVGHAHSDAHHS
jgi:uncharacterized repeat protein (TIGR01451 family)